MANIKSQKKRIITNEKARMRNRAVKSELKTATRHVKDAVAAGNGAEAYAAALAACRLMDKAASQGRHPQEPGRRPQERHHGRSSSTVVTDADRAAYVKPEEGAAEDRLQEGRDARPPARQPWKAASEEKAKRREKTAQGRGRRARSARPGEAEEAAKAEAEAAAAEGAEEAAE